MCGNRRGTTRTSPPTCPPTILPSTSHGSCCRSRRRPRRSDDWTARRRASPTSTSSSECTSDARPCSAPRLRGRTAPWTTSSPSKWELTRRRCPRSTSKKSSTTLRHSTTPSRGWTHSPLAVASCVKFTPSSCVRDVAQISRRESSAAPRTGSVRRVRPSLRPRSSPRQPRKWVTLSRHSSISYIRPRATADSHSCYAAGSFTPSSRLSTRSSTVTVAWGDSSSRCCSVRAAP